MEDEDARIFADEPPVNHLRLGERIRLEVDEAEEVEDVGVVGAHPLRRLELPPRLGVTSFLKRLAAAVVMEEEDALVERWSDSGIALWHSRGRIVSARRSAAGSAAVPPSARRRRPAAEQPAGRRRSRFS